MKRFTALLPIICLAMVSVAAKADTLKFDNSPSGTIIGPYNLTYSNGSSSEVLPLFCMNDYLEIHSGEWWGVNVVNAATYLGSAAGTTGFKFEEDAYLYSLYNGTNATDIQDALWTVFDPGTPHQNSTTWGLVNAALNFTYTSDFLSKTTFYLYDGNGTHDPSDAGAPQNFVGSSPVPEPSSLLLFGSGLLGLAGLVRRKMSHA